MAWGTSRPDGLPTILGPVGAADVTLTAGTDVAGFTAGSALIAPAAGTWAYVVDVCAIIVMGGTAPVSLVAKLKTATPTTLDTYTVSTAVLVNSAIVTLGFTLVGTGSASLYFPTGDTPSVTFTCGTTAATLKAGSRAVFSFRLVAD